MMDQNMQHGKMHWGCCWKPMLGGLLWVLSFLSFVGGLLAYWKGGQFYNVSAITWYWTALVGGVLAQGLKARHGGCGCGGSGCGCAGGKCGMDGMMQK